MLKGGGERREGMRALVRKKVDGHDQLTMCTCMEISP
jgi:hypothetical protein